MPVLLVLLGLHACSTTKFVPQDEYLLKNNKIVFEEKATVEKDKLRNYIRQKPNRKILGLKLPLSIYSLSGNKEKGPSKWLKNWGEEPVIYDKLLAERTVKQLELFMENRGYRYAEVEKQLRKNNRKAEVLYTVRPNKPYVIDELDYDIQDSLIRKIILEDTLNSFISKGILFDVEQLEEERKRIRDLLKQKGYYELSKEHVFFEADTNKAEMLVELTLGIKQYKNKRGGEVVKSDHPRYKIEDLTIFMNYQQRKVMADQAAYMNTLDTVIYDDVQFFFQDDLSVKPSTVLQMVYLQKDSLYRMNDVKQTYKHLSSIHVFKYINIQFSTVEDTVYLDRINPLKAVIQLNHSPFQSYSVELEGTNTSGDIGAGVNVGYKHKNLFRGAEAFNINFRGAIEALKRRYQNQIDNATELNTEARLELPEFLLPIRTEGFVKKYNPRTRLSLSYNYQERPDYTRTIANASFGYNWVASDAISHSVTPLDFNYVYLPANKRLEDFLDRIRQYPSVVNSYKDHLVMFTGYNFVYNNQSLRSSNEDFFFFRWNLESAGNILTGLNELTGKEPERGGYQLFNTRYAQFIRSDIDYRYYHHINENDDLVFRMFVGVGYPYGNLKTLPFEKKYFSGGANSIRAWQVRTLGPGSFTDSLTQYPNSLGDIKLEVNLEYRFKMFWVLEGALFLDAGNIWAINKNDQRASAVFDMSSFYQDIAIGTGFGTRFDFDFFVFRIDLGLKARDPALPKGNKWVIGGRKLNWQDHFNLVLGIGYPF